jgi:putative DNA primase/helicase
LRSSGANNALLILTHAKEWAGVFGFDVRSEEPLVLSRPPFRDAPAHLLAAPRPLRDGDDVRVAAQLEEKHGISLSPAAAHAALNTAAEAKPFDRVKEYLEAVRWDGTERLGTWPVRYLGVEGSDYARAVGRSWMISGVARTFVPGCKADHVLVLEGPQGIGKSSALQVLAGTEYFGDDVPAIGTKDAQQYLGALWVVELAEMDAATRAEASTLKRFLTTAVDRYRASYGRRTIPHGRRCIFAGTVNLDEYLRDETGGRRFWPVKVGSIDLQALERDRDQLWAEAVAAYRAGEPWHLTDGGIITQAVEEQAKRQESDSWEAAVSKWLKGQGGGFVTTADVLTKAIGMRLDQTDKRASNRAGAVMRRLGWTYGEGEAEVVVLGETESKRVRGWNEPQKDPMR